MKITELKTKEIVSGILLYEIVFLLFFLISNIIFAQSPFDIVLLNKSGRSELDCNDPNYTPLIPDNLISNSKIVNYITFTIKMLGGNRSALRAKRYRAGIQAPDYARLICYGVFEDFADFNAQI